MVCADETFHSMNSELRELPVVELSTLPLILKVFALLLGLDDDKVEVVFFDYYSI